MVNCSVCGHLKGLHTNGLKCRRTVREKTDKQYHCTYTCDCQHFYPEQPKPKKTWTEKQLVEAIDKSCYGKLIDKDKLVKELFKKKEDE